MVSKISPGGRSCSRPRAESLQANFFYLQTVNSGLNNVSKRTENPGQGRAVNVLRAAALRLQPAERAEGRDAARVLAAVDTEEPFFAPRRPPAVAHHPVRDDFPLHNFLAIPM